MSAAIDPRLGQYPRSHPRNHSHNQPSLPPPNVLSPHQSHQQLPSLAHSHLHQLPPLHPPHHQSSPPYTPHHQHPQHSPHLPQTQQQHSHAPRLLHDSPTHHSYYPHTPHHHHVQSPHQQVSPIDQRGEDDTASLEDPNSPDVDADDASGAPGSTPKLPDAKRPRACDSCRGLKVKCIIDPSSGEPCKRCSKAGRQCIVTPPARKRQKKADSRVAELERKIDALTATLVQRDGKLPEGFSLPEKRDYDSYESSPMIPRSGDGSDSPRNIYKRPKLEKIWNNNGNEMVMAGSEADPATKTPLGGSIYNQQKPLTYDHSDIEERLNRIISHADAERLFNRYVEEFVPQFPAVPFPPGTTAQQIRTEKPILFLAIMSGTSYGANIPDETQVALEKEIRDVLATCMWMNGERSLQLVQALQVTALWYRPPANFEQHMFYQMVHMATIMAIDIGIGRRQTSWKRKLFQNTKFQGKPFDPESAECRRAWVVNYFLCITIAMILRRPILLRYNDYMRDCIEALQKSEGTYPSDKALCQHVQLARISEDIAIHFAMDDPAVNLTISDSKVSYGIKHHEQALADLRARNVQSPSIQLTSHVTNLFLHEIALHSQNNVEDFKAPFMEESFRASVGEVVLGPGHIDALLECQNSCRKVVETFLAIDFETMFLLPVVFSVRIIYAVIVLIKLHIAATTPGEIAKIIHEKDLHLGDYLERLENLFQRIVNRDRLSPHTKFHYVVQRLIERYNAIKVRAQGAPVPATANGTPTLGESEEKIRDSPHVGNKSRPNSSAGEPVQVQHHASSNHHLHPNKQQAAGLHILSEAAMSNGESPALSAATTTINNAHQQSQHQISHHHNAAGSPVPAISSMMNPVVNSHTGVNGPAPPVTVGRPIVSHNPQSGWYTHPHPDVHAQHTHQQHPQQVSPEEMHSMGLENMPYDFGTPIVGMEGLDFGFPGLGMPGMDGAMSGLFMDSPIWGTNNMPGTFMGGWPG